MSAVSNQLSYTPIRVIPEPKPKYPRLTLLVQRVALSIVIIGFSSALGLAIGLAAFGAQWLSGAYIGGTVGAVATIAIFFFAKIPGGIESYRQNVLVEMEKGTSNPRALAALSNLKEFFYYPLTKFSHPYQHHLLHNELAAVSERLDPQRSDVFHAWKGLLSHLHGTPVKMTSGEEMKLDMGIEALRIQRQLPQLKTEWLGSYFNKGTEDYLQIQKLQRLGIGLSGGYSIDQMREKLQNGRNCYCVLSRDTLSEEILGYAWYFEKDGAVELAGIARKPECSRMGIGSDLINQVLKSQSSGKEVNLKVRKSNPALRLFKQWGFVESGELPNHFSQGPKEDGVLMKLDWDKYEAFSNRQ